MEAVFRITINVLILVVSGAYGFQFTARPSNIIIGITPRLDIRCSLSSGTEQYVSTLVSLSISSSTDLGNLAFQEIASINNFSGSLVDITHGNANLSGVISSTGGESFISMRWTYPGQQESGVYKCEANGVDSAGQPLSMVSTTEVSSEQPSMNSLIEAVRNLNIKTDHALDNICISDCWQSRLDQMKHARFDVSDVYKGHRYLLSKFDCGVSSPVAEESCELYGGYLAEFDDNDELLFVKNFLKAHSNANEVLVRIGGTDRGHEGTWVYQRNNKPVTFTKWVPGEPEGTLNHDCLYLWAHSEWLMDDALCNTLDSDKYARYLCEVSA